MLRYALPLAAILLMAGCAPRVKIADSSPQGTWTTSIPFKEGAAVKENGVWKLYLKFYSQGSRFIIDDETTFLFFLSVPVDTLDEKKSVGHAFFTRLLFGPPFEGYANIESFKIEELDQKTIEVSSVLTSTLVYTNETEEQLHASFSGVKIPVIQMFSKNELTNFDWGGFGEFYSKRFGRAWEGPEQAPPNTTTQN